MQINQEIFLLVVEEMNISRAAERAFISQQCVSDHIKRMEQGYGVQLFIRKPHLRLTEAGRSVYRALQRVRVIEEVLTANLKQYSDETRGSFRFGISSSRAQLILPWVLPEYYRKFPNVEISFVTNDTPVLAEELKKGNLDLFLGVSTPYDADFQVTPLYLDHLCLIISDELLKKEFGECTAETLSRPVNLKLLEHVPFIDSYASGTISAVFRSFLEVNRIHLKFPYQISDFDSQIALCSCGMCVTIAPFMLIPKIKAHNQICTKSQYIHAIPIEGLQSHIHIDLVSHHCTDKPFYVEEFERIVLKEVENNYTF